MPKTLISQMPSESTFRPCLTPWGHIHTSFGESRQSLLQGIPLQERKVWTSQEKIPVKDWGPQGYGKCNRKYSAGVKNWTG